MRPDNRMVGYPYTKYMVAVMDVDMAAALLVATHERADALGIPPERRVYLRGWCYADRSGARRRPSRDVALAGDGRGRVDRARRGGHRHRRRRAPRPLLVLRRARCTSRATRSGISPLDARGLTVTGGLPYHGGPGSGYLVHAIAEDGRRAARRSRRARRRQRRRHAHDQARVRRVLDDARRSRSAGRGRRCSATSTRTRRSRSSPSTTVTPTVARVLGGARPRRCARVGACSCATRGGARTYARLDDPDAGRAAEADELVGATVRLAPDDGRRADGRRASTARRVDVSSTASLTGRRPVRTLRLYTPPL